MRKFLNIKKNDYHNNKKKEQKKFCKQKNIYARAINLLEQNTMQLSTVHGDHDQYPKNSWGEMSRWGIETQTQSFHLLPKTAILFTIGLWIDDNGILQDNADTMIEILQKHYCYAFRNLIWLIRTVSGILIFNTIYWIQSLASFVY